MFIAGVEVKRLSTGAHQWNCGHGKVVNAFPAGDHLVPFASCGECPDEALRGVLDGIEASRENGNSAGAPPTERTTSQSSELNKEKAPPGEGGAFSDVAVKRGVLHPHNGNGHETKQARLSWQYLLEVRTREQLEKVGREHPIAAEMLKADSIENFIGYVNHQRSLDSTIKDPPGLTPIDIDEDIQVVARALQEGFSVPAIRNGHAPAVQNGNGADLPAIAWENFGGALIANEEYLKRTAIVEKLGYTSSVMLITGGKHAGKSTLARWMAICVAKGWPFLGREVKQGPVFYVASEDETMAARQELIRLGWTSEDPIWFLPASKIGDNSDLFLDRLAVEVKKHGAVMVVLDMLFDFVRIPDEMSYAGTREALGKIQMLASIGECLVATTHHAPKYLETADAAVTALGSQGLAARVSPILLVRKHGPGLHSIVSTTVRDPRGEAIPESKLIKNVDGSVTLGGSWKLWMQAEVFMPKVLELLETEPGQELTAGDVKEALGISYQLASGSLSKLYKESRIARTGEGKKGKPFRYSADAPDISQSDGKGGTAEPSQGPTPLQNSDPNDGRYGYKD